MAIANSELLFMQKISMAFPWAEVWNWVFHRQKFSPKENLLQKIYAMLKFFEILDPSPSSSILLNKLIK